MVFTAGPFEVDPDQIPAGAAFGIVVGLMAPRSRGWVRVTSNDPADPPRIHFGHLSEPEDLDAVLDGIIEARRIALSDPVASIVTGGELSPGPEAPPGDRRALASWALSSVSTFHHPAGTCAMGATPEAGAVTDTHGSVHISKTFDPVYGGGACATVPVSDLGAGVATYQLQPSTGSGYTLLGSPTVIADLKVTGKFAYIAARLLDVDPATNTQTLVARGVYRIDPKQPDGLQVFQLNPGAWHFAAGHVPTLELLGQDPPYTRPSNGVFSISVSNLQLRLAVHEVPGAPSTPRAVEKPLPVVKPDPMG